jgi:hypothetical protein
MNTRIKMNSVLGFPILFLSLLLLSAGLSGCAQTPEKVTVTVIKKEPIHIPESLFNKCLPATPLSKEEYLKLAQHEREAYLTKYIVNDLKVITQCNRQMAGIHDIYTKHVTSVE